MRIFEGGKDYEAFETVLEETWAICPMRICAYCLMPNHWHLVLWPEHDGALATFMHRLTTTHAARWQAFRQKTGTGHLYQARYKSFPVGDEHYFYTVIRYVERNALRANLVTRAEDWKWSSLWRRVHGNKAQTFFLSEWPEPEPSDWISFVNEPLTGDKLSEVRTCVQRGRPYGEVEWVQQTASALGLEHTLRSRGRPRREEW